MAVLDALVKSGATQEMLVAAMRADIAEREAAEAAKLEKKRVGNRERQQRKRDNDRNAVSRVTPVTARDPAPNERDNLTPTRVEKPSPKGESKNPVVQDEKRQAIASCLRVAFPPPNGVSDEVWGDFLRSPKRRKAGMSKTAYSGICNNLMLLAEHGFPPGEMIALAVERGWTTVKLEWVQNEQRTNSLGRNQPADGLSSTARAAIAVFGAPSAGHQR
jgi:hypothetical protein